MPSYLKEMAEDSKLTYRPVYIGDPSDWRLLCVISGEGIEAYLKNTEDPTAGITTLIKENWDSENTGILERIESVVYENPRILDDYSSEISIITPNSLWVPKSHIEEMEDEGDGIYNKVFTAASEDILKDYIDDKVCLYSGVRGLASFLQRTFPGARIRSHQSIMVDRLGRRSAEMPRLYVNMRTHEVDFVLFNQSNLISAVTYNLKTQDAIRYRLFNMLDVYDINPNEVHVSISSDILLRDVKMKFISKLREDVAYVMMTTVPGRAMKSDMSFIASLMLRS